MSSFTPEQRTYIKERIKKLRRPWDAGLDENETSYVINQLFAKNGKALHPRLRTLAL